MLLADDHAAVRDSLKRLLECEPEFEVVGGASDGGQAVDMAQQLQPNVVLMDMRMPRMDGLEATKQILAALPNVRVIGLSLYSDESAVEGMLRAGATACVDKASSPETLFTAIREAAGREQEGQGAGG